MDFDKTAKRLGMSSPSRLLDAMRTPSSNKKRSVYHQSTVRKALNYDMLGRHVYDMEHLDNMLKRINMQLDSSARCLEKFSNRH